MTLETVFFNSLKQLFFLKSFNFVFIMAKKHGDVSIFIYINYLLEVVFIIAFEYIVRTLNPKKCNFNAPAIRKNFFSKFDKYNILAL